jgi:hypothetical protein
MPDRFDEMKNIHLELQRAAKSSPFLARMAGSYRE